MIETAKERIYREAKKRINMRKNGIHPSDYFEGWVVDYIDSSTTDKLSVEKLQEQLNTAKKALEYIINSNDTAFGFVNSNLRRYVEDALAAIGGDDDENRL